MSGIKLTSYQERRSTGRQRSRLRRDNGADERDRPERDPRPGNTR
jgi:hypothetical protein